MQTMPGTFLKRGRFLQRVAGAVGRATAADREGVVMEHSCVETSQPLNSEVFPPIRPHCQLGSLVRSMNSLPFCWK